MKNILLFSALLFQFIAHSQSLHHTFYFDVAQSKLNAIESQKLTTFLIDSISKLKVLSITGYTDTTGSQKSNLLLAKNRANEITSLLGLSSNVEQIIIGESYPIPTNYQLAQFRKVELEYTLLLDRRVTVVNTVPILVESQLNKGVREFVEDVNMKSFSFDLSILFYNASDEVLPESYPQLEELLQIMNNNPDLSIVIHGHVCCTKSYDISLHRAQRVYYYLAGNKVDVRRMSYLGHSNDQPKVFPELTEEDFKQNRRVAIEFVKK